MTRILLVDDSDQVRRSVRELLAEVLADVAVGEAGGAVEALALLDRETWDVVLLDLSLPDRNGMDTLRDIRRMRPTLPVLVMSFHTEAEYATAVRAAGAAGYVAKGSSSGVIATAVKSALSIRG
jgi:two-component system, NarL family, invasion response regulator UvrY